MDIEKLRAVMSTEDGRQAIHDILTLTGVYSTYYGESVTNMVLVGRRTIGTEILQHIRNIKKVGEAEDGLALEYRMLREAQERQERETEAAKKAWENFYRKDD